MSKWYGRLGIKSKVILPFMFGLVVIFIAFYYTLKKAGALPTPHASTVLLISLAAIYVAILIALWNTARVIIKELNELSVFAKKLSEGNTDFAIETTGGKNEMGRLADSIRKVQSSVMQMSEDIIRESENILNGDLRELEHLSDYPGDYGRIMNGMNDIIQVISRLICNLKKSSENVASATNQISENAQALAQGSTEQAAAIEEISGMLSEIAAQSKENAKNTEKTKDISGKIHLDALDTGKEMQQLQGAMADINASSESIGKIIKTIGDIAFQTNILSLNAAVEAARAGIHGQGFSVVAKEVKALAEKSAKAAEETEELIYSNLEKTQYGSKISGHANESLDRILQSIDQAVEAILGIADATQQQVSAIDQVNTGVGQIAAVVQGNTAGAEESAAASSDLFEQVKSLNKLVRHYSV